MEEENGLVMIYLGNSLIFYSSDINWLISLFYITEIAGVIHLRLGKEYIIMVVVQMKC